jgi:uncharacterized membrane protein (DUF485 family)
VGEGYIRWIINKFFERGKGKNRKRKSKEPLLMNEKTLEPDSDFAKYDLDGDGVVTDEELEMDAKMMRLENEDKKEDAQRFMAWFALFGMLLYPSLVVLSTFIGLDKAASILGDMAATYFVSVAAIVAAFFGKEAYVKSKNAEVSIKK